MCVSAVTATLLSSAAGQQMARTIGRSVDSADCEPAAAAASAAHSTTQQTSSASIALQPTERRADTAESYTTDAAEPPRLLASASPAMLLTPGSLVVLLVFVPLSRLNSAWHLLHCALFRGLTFYLPPSDEQLGALQLQAARVADSSGRLKRRLRKAGVNQLPDSVELHPARLNGPLYALQNSPRYASLQWWCGVHLALLLLLLADGATGCVRTQTNLEQEDGSLLSVSWGAPSSASSVLLLAMGLAYDLYVGLVSLRSGASDGANFKRLAAGVGFLLGLLALFLQSLGSRSGLTSEFPSSDPELYARYINQAAHNALSSARAALARSATNSGAEMPQSWQSMLSTIPASPSEMHVEQWLPLGAFKLLIGVLCACISVSFLSGAWRAARLLLEKLEENEEALADDEPASAAGGQGRWWRALRLRLSSARHWLALFTPLLVTLLWLPPLSSHIWLRSFAGATATPALYLRAWRLFESARVLLVLAGLVLRLSLLRSQLQSFFYSALGLIRNLPRAASSSSGADPTVAPRIQTLLRSVFWSGPAVAAQLLFPLGLTALLLGCYVLAWQWAPEGLEQHAPHAANAAGFGLCFHMFGRGLSPFALSAIVPAAPASPLAPPVVPTASIPSVPLDADEFEGELSALEEEENVATASAASLASVGDAGSISLAQWVPPARANVLATALGFLVWWCHFVWFVESVICFSYLRFVKRTPTSSAVNRIESAQELDATGSATSSASSVSAASGLRQRAGKQKA